MATLLSRPVGRSGIRGAVEDEVDATALSNAELSWVEGPATALPLALSSHGLGLGGSDDAILAAPLKVLDEDASDQAKSLLIVLLQV